jgi:O-antigen ligase
MHLSLDRYRLAARLYGMAFIPVALWVIILTDSRLGVVAALASVMFYLLIWALIRWRQHTQSIIGPAIVIAYPAIFVAAVAATFLVGRLRHQVWGDGSQQASTDARIDQWNMAIPKVVRNPLGNGLGQGADVLGYANQAGAITIDSYYISVLLELGIIGFILYYGMIIRAIWTATRTAIDSRGEQEIRLLLPISVSLINYVIVKSVLSQDANHPLAFMMLGAVVALTYRARKQAPPAAGSV